MQKGAKTDTVDGQGKTLLDYALIIGNLKMVKALVDHGANINNPNRFSCNSLDWVIVYGKKDIYQYLRNNGGNLTYILNNIMEKNGFEVTSEFAREFLGLNN